MRRLTTRIGLPAALGSAILWGALEFVALQRARLSHRARRRVVVRSTRGRSPRGSA